MRAVIQRVKNTSVFIEGLAYATIEKGLLVLVGIENEDTRGDTEWLAKKISQLRIFDDEKGIMNLSVNEINGEIMAISQFTLHAKTKKGNRPSYVHAAPQEKALPVYNDFVRMLDERINTKIKTGVFGAHMEVSLINDGPVTIFIDTKKKE